MARSDRVNVSKETLERESLSWVNQLLSGAVTRDQAQAFRIWWETSPEHAEAFVQAVEFRRFVRTAVHAERRNLAHVEHPRWARVQRRSLTSRATRRTVLGGAAAAAGAMYMLVRPPEHLWPSWSELTSDYRTAPGERREVSAANGVSLDLNTRTSIIRRTFAGAAGVELVSGEAAATIPVLKASAFTIAAGVGRTTFTLGMANIRAEEGDVCVTCLKDRVAITHPGGRRHLVAGQQVIYTSRNLGFPRDVDAGLITSWRRGLLIFRNAPLQQVVDELNRYRSGRIILTTAGLARRPVYGVFQISQIAQAVLQLQGLTGARATHLPGGIVLLT